MWQKAVQPLIESGRLKVVGVVQEQHPDRAALYAQWRKIDWPIFVDSLNLLDSSAVPRVIALDEAGVVRHTNLTVGRLKEVFVDQEYPTSSVPRSLGRVKQPNLKKAMATASRIKNVFTWRRAGDAYFLHGKSEALNVSIKAYQRAVDQNLGDGKSEFRLGVALWKRHESPMRATGDAQKAIDHWCKALAADPNQYIWRRRLQQYGPRLDKPYDFYTWVRSARADIRKRGEQPIKLEIPPSGSEIVSRSAPPEAYPMATNVDRDPEGKIVRDRSLIQVTTMVTPAGVRPGHRGRVRMEFRPSPRTNPWWNNETDELSVWVDLPNGFSLGEGSLTYPNPKKPETRELRIVEFEVAVATDGARGIVEVPAYALYYVCEDKGGKCLYRRKDFSITVVVDDDAVTLK